MDYADDGVERHRPLGNLLDYLPDRLETVAECRSESGLIRRQAGHLYKFYKSLQAPEPWFEVTIKKWEPTKWIETFGLGKSTLILAPTESGKTMFIVWLLRKFIQTYQQKHNVAIIVFTNTPSALQKMKWANDAPFEDNPDGTPAPKIDVDRQVIIISEYTELAFIYGLLAFRASKINPDVKPSEFTRFYSEHVNEYPALARVLEHFDHYIFHFDDCNDIYKSPQYRSFFTSMPTQHRHFDMTVFYCMQSLNHVFSEIKTQIKTFITLGPCFELLIHKNIQQVNSVFAQASFYTRFLNSFSELFRTPKYTISVYTQGQLTQFCVPRAFSTYISGRDKQFLEEKASLSLVQTSKKRGSDVKGPPAKKIASAK